MANSELDPETEKMLRKLCLKYGPTAAFDCLPALRKLLVLMREADAQKADEADDRGEQTAGAAIRSQIYADLMEIEERE